MEHSYQKHKLNERHIGQLKKKKQKIQKRKKRYQKKEPWTRKRLSPRYFSAPGCTQRGTDS